MGLAHMPSGLAYSPRTAEILAAPPAEPTALPAAWLELPPPTPSKAYTGEKISLNLQAIEVRAALQVLAEFSGFNIVVSDGVTGSISLRLKDVPWDQALDVILLARGLAGRRSGAVLWIAPQAEMLARDTQQSTAAVAGNRPQTQHIRLNYAKADEVGRKLGAGVGGGRLLSPQGSVFADPRTNQLVLTDTLARLAIIQSVVAKLDVPVRQVMIEARIVEAADSFGKSLGVRFGGRPFAVPASPGNPGLQAGANYLAPTYPASGQAVLGRDFGMSGADMVSLPANAINGVPAANFAVSLFNASLTRVLNVELSALEAEGQGRIVASPRLVTADQVKALIEQGTELPYQQATSSGATAVMFRKANLKLEVTPQITPEGNIILNVDVNKDSVGRITPNGFAIDTKHVQTQVLVDNGGTVVIGGIFDEAEQAQESRVPWLGGLPVLGHLFKNRSRQTSKSELLIFISPQVLP